MFYFNKEIHWWFSFSYFEKKYKLEISIVFCCCHSVDNIYHLHGWAGKLFFFQKHVVYANVQWPSLCKKKMERMGVMNVRSYWLRISWYSAKNLKISENFLNFLACPPPLCVMINKRWWFLIEAGQYIFIFKTFFVMCFFSRLSNRDWIWINGWS